jgi:hypothetical protein
MDHAQTRGQQEQYRPIEQTGLIGLRGVLALVYAKFSFSNPALCPEPEQSLELSTWWEIASSLGTKAAAFPPKTLPTSKNCPHPALCLPVLAGHKLLPGPLAGMAWLQQDQLLGITAMASMVCPILLDP